MKSLKFRLGGKPFEPTNMSKRWINLIAKLDLQKDGELLNSKDLATLAGISHAAIRCEAPAIEALTPYRLKMRFPSVYILWGNRRTIAELKKHKELLA